MQHQNLCAVEKDCLAGQKFHNGSLRTYWSRWRGEFPNIHRGLHQREHVSTCESSRKRGQSTNPPLTHPTSSELSCFAACGSPFLCLPASAGAVALLTYLATTVPLAHRQGFFAVEGWHSSGLQPGSAEKQGQGSQPTPGWQTSTWHKSPVKMTDASKSLPMA